MMKARAALPSRTRTRALVATVVLGLVAGCGAPPKAKEPSTDAPLPMDKNCCRGSNACRGQSGCKSDKNDCAGQNGCKGQGTACPRALP